MNLRGEQQFLIVPILILFMVGCAVFMQLSGLAQGDKPAPVSVPPTQAKQLKELDTWINARITEYQIQRLIVAQRTCLELHMDATACDNSEIVVDEAGNYIVRPKAKSTATPTP